MKEIISTIKEALFEYFVALLFMVVVGGIIVVPIILTYYTINHAI